MQRYKNNTSAKIADELSNLIKLTKDADLNFTTQLLQMAHLDLVMQQHGIAPDELDALRATLEHQASTGPVLDFEELRKQRATGKR